MRTSAIAASLAFSIAAPTVAAAEQSYFWSNTYQPVLSAPPLRVRRAKPVGEQRPGSKAETIASDGRKPQGQLVIAISIQRQQVRIYDAKGLFAESPISSGMAGHSTPMGVFSVIQKHKYHHSNIYSGAPMPYMQRITWSGVAMHAGVLPGYPASHGCIRMPMSFAMKMWAWTKMGARVVVTSGEVSPVDFAHPLLAALVPLAPVAALPAPVNVRTADASGAMAMGLPRVMADATLSNAATARAPESAAGAGAVIQVAAAAAEIEIPVLQAEPEPEPPVEAADISDGGPVTALPSGVADPISASSAEAAAALAEPAKPVEVEVAESATASIPVVEAKPPQPQGDVPKDQAQLAPSLPTESAPVALVPAMKGKGPVAMFVSRKDGKLYVRQNFKPLFDMPIAIAASDKPLGTHVFTASRSTDDDKDLRWSVVSLPSTARQASVSAAARGTGRRRAADPVQTAAATPDEALSRLAIPSEVMARLGDALPPGSSLVVSDQGIAQGETGEGTDFIVRLR